MESLGVILAKLVALGMRGECGPFGGEDPFIAWGNELHLTTQGPDSIYRFNNDGSVDEVWGTKKETISDLMDVGYDREDAEERWTEGPLHYKTVKSLLDDGGCTTTWFYEFQNNHPHLYKAIVAILDDMGIDYENTED